MRYADIIVDNNAFATDELYSYACPFDDVSVGCRVRVPFGVHNKELDGYVARVAAEPPAGIKRFKEILSVDREHAITAEAVETALWLHGRYLCRYWEAVRCFLPASAPAKRATKDPFAEVEALPETPKELTAEQETALTDLSGALDARRHEIFLLKGVTGSGKTEVYLRAMERVIAQGRQGIVLVPEIALTPQTVSRFVARFGKDRIAVMHSKLTPKQKAEQYKRIEDGSVSLVIGARSAVFAPFGNIGLIVVDEEHETSYKSDSSPKYDGIEVAAFRAARHGAVLLLGSATPSVADYRRCEEGVFHLLTLTERYNRNPMPAVEIVDMREEIRHGNRSIFSERLAGAMQECLDAGWQIILFLNRRGYSSFVSCRECGYVVKCIECGISMTYHKEERSMVCHYCGRRLPIPASCPDCGSSIIGRYGVGTEQVEEKTKELFPDARVARLDLDTVNKKGSLESVLKKFGKGQTDILIGTQLVAKGLDFSNVGLVGIVNADVTLNIPDYRSAERTFQLVTQAAGRAGRGEERGRVIIQSCQADHPALLYASRHDYEGFYKREREIRRAAGYPPFTDIFQLIVQDESLEKAEDSARRCAAWLRRKLPEGMYVLGPAEATLKRAEGRCRFQLLIKAPYGRRREVRDVMLALRRVYTAQKDVAELLTTDINPYSFL